jgi:two-component system NtrC family sensor kinase
MQKQMAQADKLASIGELSSGIAHEINNPLGIIWATPSCCCAAKPLNRTAYNDLKTIEKHVQSCKAIVEDLLNFARTSSPRKAKLDIHSRD